MKKVTTNYDQLPPARLCPPGWDLAIIRTRQGALVAADYWDDLMEYEFAVWLRNWAELSPDGVESVGGRHPKSYTRGKANRVFDSGQLGRLKRKLGEKG